MFWTRTLRNHFISLHAYYWNRELVSPPHGTIFWSKPYASQGHLWVKGWIRSPEIVRIGHQHLWTLCKFTSWDQKQLSAETAQKNGTEPWLSFPFGQRMLKTLCFSIQIAVINLSERSKIAVSCRDDRIIFYHFVKANTSKKGNIFHNPI